jgi:hypothetical protein
VLSSFAAVLRLQPKVFIQHAARKTRSAEGIIPDLVIPVDRRRTYFTADEYNYLRAFEPGPMLMRGTDSGAGDRNKEVWEQMEIGDVALIAWGGHIEAAGEIVMRKDSPALAKLQNHGSYHCPVLPSQCRAPSHPLCAREQRLRIQAWQHVPSL